MIKNFNRHSTMHPSTCLLFAAIILTTFQSCFFSKGPKESLAQQMPSYAVSLRSEKSTGYFEDQKIPIDILFASEDASIKDNRMGFRIKNISIEEIAGHLETTNGDFLEDGFDFFYKNDGHQLFFVPEANQDSGRCEIALDTLLITSARD